jgi:enoyl-CoA hydratase/carnithine racemase
VSVDGLRAERDGEVATLWLDRPAKRNAVTRAMWAALPGVLDELAADADVRVVVVRGTEGTFSAGADVGELRAQLDAGAVADATLAAEGVDADDTDGSGIQELSQTAEEALARFPKPTVAFVQGACVGGGCMIAVACDLRVADTTARFGVTPARLGLVYPSSAVERLVHLVGPSASKWLIYTGDLVDVNWAQRNGLVDAVHPPDRAEAAVTALVTTLAARSLLTQRAAKEMVAAVLEHGMIDEVMAQRWATEARKGPDAAEGVAAFLERRPPRFTWQ